MNVSAHLAGEPLPMDLTFRDQLEAYLARNLELPDSAYSIFDLNHLESAAELSKLRPRDFRRVLAAALEEDRSTTALREEIARRRSQDELGTKGWLALGAGPPPASHTWPLEQDAFLNWLKQKRGRPVDAVYEVVAALKRWTYSDILAEPTPDGWQAQVVAVADGERLNGPHANSLSWRDARQQAAIDFWQAYVSGELTLLSGQSGGEASGTHPWMTKPVDGS